MPVVIPVARSFSTRDVPTDRVRQWEQHNAAALVALACDAPADDRFQAVETNLQLEQLHLARVRGTRHAVVRDSALVESHPSESIAVYAARCGEAVFEHAGRRAVVRAGDLVVCDADQAFARSFGQGLDELAVRIPRVALAAATGRQTLGPLVVSGDRHVRSLVGMVGRALRAVDAVPADEQAVLELVAVVATGGRVDAALAHRVRARAYIEDRLDDPTLCASDVAASAGISERTLSRIFAAVGTSVPRHVLDRRLDMAHGLLSDGAAQRTADVAARCGFVSATYFSQSFRRRFGVTAGHLRRGATG